MKRLVTYTFLFALSVIISVLLLSSAFAAFQTVNLESVADSQEPSQVVNTISIVSSDVPPPVVQKVYIDQFLVNQYDLPQVQVSPRPEPVFEVIQTQPESINLPTIQIPVEPIPDFEVEVVVEETTGANEPVIEIPAEVSVEPFSAEESFILYAYQENLSLESCHQYSEVMTIENNGQTKSTYWISANKFIASRLALSQQNITLQPGESTQVTLYLTLECGLESTEEYELTVESDTLIQTFSRPLEIYSNANVAFVLKTQTLSSCSCENNTIPFTVTNTGTHPENYSFSVSEYPDSLFFTQNSVYLQPNETYAGELVAAFCGSFGKRDFTFTVETQYTQLSASHYVNYDVSACADYTIGIPSSVSVCRYADTVVDFPFVNEATFANSFTFDIDDKYDITTISQSELTVNASNQSNMHLLITSGSTPVGQYNISLFTTNVYTDEMTQTQVTLDVVDCHDYTTVAATKTIDVCPEIETIPITIENTGVYEETFNFTAAINEQYLAAVSLSNSSFTLAPGENNTLAVIINGSALPPKRTIPLDVITTLGSTPYRDNVLELKLQTHSAQTCYGLDLPRKATPIYDENGELESLEFLVTNDGLRGGMYNVTMEGPQWATLLPNQFAFSSDQVVILNISRNDSLVVANQSYDFTITAERVGYAQVDTIRYAHNTTPAWVYVLVGLLLLAIIIVLFILFPYWIVLIILAVLVLIGGLLLLAPLFNFGGSEVHEINESVENESLTYNETVGSTPNETVITSPNETEVVDSDSEEIFVNDTDDDRTEPTDVDVSEPIVDSSNETVSEPVYTTPVDEEPQYVILTRSDFLVSPTEFQTITVAENESSIMHTFTVQNVADETKNVSFIFNSPDWMNIDLTKATLSANETVEINIFSRPNESVETQLYRPVFIIADTTADVNQSTEIKIYHNIEPVSGKLLILGVIILALVLAFLFFPFWLVIAFVAFIIPLTLGVGFVIFETGQLLLTAPEVVEEAIDVAEHNMTESVVLVDPRISDIEDFLANGSLRENTSKLVLIDTNTSYLLDLANSFTDPDNDSLTYSVLANDVTNLTLSMQNESLLITPDDNYIGRNVIHILADDGQIEVRSPDIHLIVGPSGVLDTYRGMKSSFFYWAILVVLILIVIIVVVDIFRFKKTSGKKPRKKRVKKAVKK